MRSRINPAISKLASLFRWTRERYRQDVRVRYGVFALAADGVGLGLVFFLTRGGYLGNVGANVAVSKGMAPVGLALNSLAITGRLIPTRKHAVNWFAGWLPTSLASTGYMILLLSMVSLGGVSARLLVGITFFPFDYGLKKKVVFGEYGELLRHYLFKACVYHQIGALLKAERPGFPPGLSFLVKRAPNFSPGSRRTRVDVV